MTRRPYPLGELAALVPLATLVIVLVGFASPAAIVLAAAAAGAAVMILSERARRAQLDELVAFGPRSVAKVLRPTDVGIAPSPIARQDYPDQAYPPYVSREPEDKKIRERMLELRTVTISGNRHAGKTQSAFEAVRKLPRARILIPRQPTESQNPLVELLKAPWLLGRLRPHVIFVDRLDKYLDGVSRQDIARWLEHRPKAVFVATIPQSRCDELLDPESDSYDHNRQVLGDGSLVELADVLEGTSLKQAEERYGQRPEVARLGAYLAGADAIERRLVAARRERPLAHALAMAAIKAAHVGLTRPIARAHLRILAERLDPALAESPDDAWADAFQHCALEVPGVTAMLVLHETENSEPRLGANSILVDAVARGTGTVTGAAAVPPDLWRTIAATLTQSSGDLIAIADAAASCLRETRWPGELREFALELLKFAAHDPDPAIAAAATKVATRMHRSDEPGELTEALDHSLYGPPPPPTDPSESQVEQANRRSRSVREEEETPFDPALPPAGRPPFIYRVRGVRAGLRFFVLLACDLVGLIGGIALAATVQNLLQGSTEPLETLVKGSLIAMPLVVVLFAYFGLYRPDGERARLSEVVNGMSITALVLALAVVATEPLVSTVELVTGAVVGASTIAFLLRWSYDQVSRRWVVRHGLQARTLLLAPAGEAAQTASLLLQASRRPTQFVGFATAEQSDHRAQLGTLDQFDAIVSDFYVQRVILADRGIEPQGRSDIAARCHAKGIPVEMMPSTDELLQGASEAVTDLVVPLIELPPLYLSPVSSAVKRAVDLGVAALLSAALLLPAVLLLSTLSVLARGRWPVVWSFRLGKGTEPFAMYRLRLTRGGRVSDAVNTLLQRYRVDELPQLINVLRGDMSLVGPRPLTVDEFAHLSPSQRRRYAVKPGISGLWQIARRKHPTMDDMAALDLTYCRRWSLLLDFTIMLRTVPAIVFAPP